jgi:1-deoxy-D-xylulose-5-phosphate reductoisomerase
MPAVLNAANETAVQAFLDGKIQLNEIALVNGAVMDEHDAAGASSLEAVLAADEWARSRAIMKMGMTASAT